MQQPKNLKMKKTSNFEVVSTGQFSQNLTRDGRSSPCHRSFLWPVPVGHCVSGQTQNGFLYKWGRLSQRIPCIWFPQSRLLGKPYFLGLKLPWWEVSVTRKCVLALVKWNSEASECGCEIWSPAWWTSQAAQSFCIKVKLGGNAQLELFSRHCQEQLMRS